MESLNVKANHGLGDEGVVALLKSASSHRKLKFLSLVDTGLTRASASPVSALLQDSTALRQLELKGNSFDCEGVEQIAEGLGKNRGLKELHLAGNPISNKGAKALSKAVQRNRALEEVNIKACYVDDEDTALELKYALRSNQGVPNYQIEVERREEMLANAKRRALASEKASADDANAPVKKEEEDQEEERKGG